MTQTGRAKALEAWDLKLCGKGLRQFRRYWGAAGQVGLLKRAYIKGFRRLPSPLWRLWGWVEGGTW